MMSLRTKEKWTAIGSKAYKAGLQRVVVDGHIRVTLSLNRLTRRQCQIAERRRVTWWKGERRWKMLTFHLIIPSAVPNVIHFSWQVSSISLPASPLHALSRFKSRLYLFVIVFYAGHPLMDANRIYTHPYCVYTLYFFFFLASVDNELDCFQWVVKEEMDGRRASLSLQPSQTRRWFGWGGEKKKIIDFRRITLAWLDDPSVDRRNFHPRSNCSLAPNPPLQVDCARPAK